MLLMQWGLMQSVRDYSPVWMMLLLIMHLCLPLRDLCWVAITVFMGVVAGLRIFFPALFLYPCLIHVPPTP